MARFIRSDLRRGEKRLLRHRGAVARRARVRPVRLRLAILGLDPRQPRLPPEEKTAGLAAAVRRPVAAQVLEMDGGLHPPILLPVDRVASLVRARLYSIPSTAVGEHLRHKRQAVKLPVRIERLENLFLASNLDDISRP